MRYISAYQHVCYKFSVSGQPTPAPRLTQARKFDPRLHADRPPPELAQELAQEARAQVITRGYYAFKAAVVAALIDAYPTEMLLQQHIVMTGHPFQFRPGREGPCAIVEYWLFMAQTGTSRCTHGDPDNIAKAILDALFRDDRHVLPRCQGLTCGVERPHVDIHVTLIGA